ncbi:MAG: hypothetical protein WBD36_07485 [Bacteroidota bacterium]
MTKPKILISILASLLYGCSTTHTVVAPSTRNPFTEAQFTDHILGRNVTVEFNDGREVDAIQFEVRGDSCVWRDPRTDLPSVVRTKDINTVVSRDHLVGGLEGLGIGFGVGEIAGALVGSAVLGKGSTGPESNKDAFVVIFYGLYGGICGALAGTVYGALSGHKHEYEFAWFSNKSTLKAGMKAQPKEKPNKE